MPCIHISGVWYFSYITEAINNQAQILIADRLSIFDLFSDFIQPDAEHIRGTECDQKILSKKESSGVVYSPNYPFPYQSNVVCRYFIYGMQDEQNLERVRLTFEKFNIPMMEGAVPMVSHDYMPISMCQDGYLKVYMKGNTQNDT